MLAGEPRWQQVLRQVLRTVRWTKIHWVIEVVSVSDILNLTDKVEGTTAFIS